ncbi:MAG: hypothetical protein M0Z85_10670 [Gammaproteobacteria bacterium]|nr:hypothetical protein [Gammaproteobacteria bacterium]
MDYPIRKETKTDAVHLNQKQLAVVCLRISEPTRERWRSEGVLSATMRKAIGRRAHHLRPGAHHDTS